MHPLLPLAAGLVSPLAERVVDGIREPLRFADQFLLGHESAGEAQTAADSAGLVGADSASRPHLPRVDHLAEFIDRELGAFAERFQARLDSLGIDTSEPIDLKASGQGEIVVDSPHPQRAEIEAVLRADAKLATAFRRSTAAAHALDRLLDPSSSLQRDLRVRFEQGTASLAEI